MTGSSRTRVVKYGSSTLVAVLALLASLVTINFLATRYHHRIDITEGGMHSLSDQTATLLDSLTTDVRVMAFFHETDPQAAEFRERLETYAYHSDRFAYTMVDPAVHPGEARRYRVVKPRISIVMSEGREERVAGTEENHLTNAVAKVVRKREKTVYFSTGHGERSLKAPEGDFIRVGQALREVGYAVRDTLVLDAGKGVPADCDLLIVAGPTAAFSGIEADSIRSYLAGGGSGFFMLDPGGDTGLESLLARWGIQVNNDYVLGWGPGDPSMPGSVWYARHPVTEKHLKRNLRTFYRLARSVTRSETATGVQIHQLVETHPRNSWKEKTLPDASPVFDPGLDTPGPASVAVATIDRPKYRRNPSSDVGLRHTRIVVFGDSDFAGNEFFDTVGNGDLFMNAVSWLMEEGDLISIRPKMWAFRGVIMSAEDLLWLTWLSMVILPAIPVVIGIGVWRKRR